MTSTRSLRSLQLAYGLALVLLVGITGVAGTVGLVLSERWSGEARRIDALLRLAEEARGDHFLADPEAAGQYRAFGEALAAKLAELESLARTRVPKPTSGFHTCIEAVSSVYSHPATVPVKGSKREQGSVGSRLRDPIVALAVPATVSGERASIYGHWATGKAGCA